MFLTTLSKSYYGTMSRIDYRDYRKDTWGFRDFLRVYSSVAGQPGAIPTSIARRLHGVSDFPVFRLIYGCPASVTVRRRST